MTVLYISYDGILEPLGQSQVLRYLERLASHHRITLVSFEKAEDWADEPRRMALQQKVQDAGIEWVPLRYHKRPSAIATAFDILQGTLVSAWLVVTRRVRIVHARSYVASVMALAVKKMFPVQYVFDMRGFWADERVDGGLWPANGRLYRTAKWFERRFLLNADRVVSLTQAAVAEMRQFPFLQSAMPTFEVITTCADLSLFRPATAQARQQSQPFTVGYVGSAGGWYMFDETLRCFQLLRELVPDAKLHILNRGGHDYIRDRLAHAKIDPACVSLESGNHEFVAQAMQRMDAGIFFYRPTFSRKATAPTRLGEFLGCGVPCLGNAGVGDTGEILEGDGVGIVLRAFDDDSMRNAVQRLLALARDARIGERCRQVALARFSLEDGVQHYSRIYEDLGLKAEAR